MQLVINLHQSHCAPTKFQNQQWNISPTESSKNPLIHLPRHLKLTAGRITSGRTLIFLSEECRYAAKSAGEQLKNAEVISCCPAGKGLSGRGEVGCRNRLTKAFIFKRTSCELVSLRGSSQLIICF